MAFQQGLSGLNGASKSLDAIGNNVSNASTVGFKQAQAQFADLFANSLSGAGASQIGIGTKIATIAQQFTQGNLTVTSNPLDVAINGKGFFRLDQNGVVVYSRNGQFQFDSEGFIVNSADLKLTGYSADANGNIVRAAPAAIQISLADVSPQVTSEFRMVVNLPSTESAPTVTTFNPNDTKSYTRSTPGTIYDTLGNAHVLNTFYVKTTTPNQWQVYATIDGTQTGADLGAGASQPITLNFDSSGTLTTAMPLSASMAVSTGAASPVAFTLDYTGTTQFGSPFGVNDLQQDGYASGRLAGFDIGDDGIILGRYTNGKSRTLGQIVLADFRNPQGLGSLGNNLWTETSRSGLPVVGEPLTGSLGALQSSAVEDSNVDLTTELVNMITAQRIYQANAQTIKTQDTILQTIVNLT